MIEPKIVASTGMYPREEGGGYWLARCSSLTVDISGCDSPGTQHSLPGGANGDSGKALALQVILATKDAKLYRRFPFNVEIIMDERVVRVVEFAHEHEEKSFELSPGADGHISFSVISELSVIPAEAGLGADQRELSVLASFSAVPASPVPAIGAGGPHLGPWLQTAIPAIEEMPRPVFVVGMYRSGTSVLTWAIGQHPNIWALEETGWLPIYANGISGAWRRASSATRSFARVYELQEQQFFAFFGQTLDRLMKTLSKEHTMRIMLGRLAGHDPDFVPQIQMLRALGSSKQRWVDGTPENAMAIGLLRRLFPGGKFIHIVRPPAEVVASWAQFGAAQGMRTHQESLAAWRERVSLAYLAERAFGSDVVMRIRYPDVVADPKTALSRIFAFLEEPDFDTAAEVYQVRLNSSRTTPEEIWQVETSLDWELEAAQQLYHDASAPLDEPLRPDPEAQRELDEMINDATERLMVLFG
jgi:hypothetical protein